jgi:hypothetical protein
MESIYAASFESKSSAKAVDLDHRKRSIPILANTMLLFQKESFNLPIYIG